MEHHLRCTAVRESTRWFGIAVPATTVLGWLLLDSALVSTDVARYALHVQALYGGHIAARHVRGCDPLGGTRDRSTTPLIARLSGLGHGMPPFVAFS